MKIKVEEITEGDKFLSPTGFQHWTALTNAEVMEGIVSGGAVIQVMVQFVDGGVEQRVWDAGTEIAVERA